MPAFLRRAGQLEGPPRQASIRQHPPTAQRSSARRVAHAEGEDRLASNHSQQQEAAEESSSTPDSAPMWRSDAAPEPRPRLASEPESAQGDGRADASVAAAEAAENGGLTKNGELQAVKRGRWSPDELQRLEELYGRRDDAAIARELGRTVPSVRAQAQKLFGDRQRSDPWTPEETERLKDYIGASSTDVIARIFGRHPREVSERIESLDSKVKSGDWARDEVQRLRQLYGRRTDQDLARILGRPVEEIEAKATEYALRKDKAFTRKLEGASATRMPRWTEAELQTLREVYPLRPNLEIAHQLKRSVKSVVSKAYHLGLKKDPERLREMGRENVALRYEVEEN